MQRTKKLSLQAESISKSMEQIRFVTQTFLTPNMPGLAIPAQMSIDMSTGCKNTTNSQEVTAYKHFSNSFKYLDQVATRLCAIMLFE